LLNILSDSELFYLLSLSQIPGIGPISGKILISHCGSAEAVFKEKRRLLEKIPGIGSIGAQAIKQENGALAAEKELRFIDKHGVRALPYTSTEYPIRLKQILDSPLVLFIRGNTALNPLRTAAIVGTRKNTATGAQLTKNIVADLKPHACHIISGLAFGIDIIAHKTALDEQIPTVAVVAHGLDLVYPLRHKAVADRMLENGGAIVSELFSGTTLHPDLFPRRNRIVAGMSDAVIVIESMVRGGSMITAQIAHSYDRDVFAVPGKPGDKMSEGCNFLIKHLKAGMCENAADIARGMNWDMDIGVRKNRQTTMFFNLTPEEKLIADNLRKKQSHIDELLLATGLPMSRLSLLLLELEMKQMVLSLPGKVYKLAS
jgi:DNA processing protein